ncbi:MAG TPA: hypothetical protein VG755_07790 [Nannocystaceae bacterium]|nr:hypothetical protein [Nannocystaceae bacterium]
MKLLRAIPLVVLGLACACKSTGASAPPATSAVDPLADAESRLADNATNMRALGLELGATATKDEERKSAESPPPPPPPLDDGPSGGGSKNVAPTKPEPATETETSATSASTRANDRCEQICELAEVACGLQEQICTLAESHVGEPRYEDACWRARDQCDVGQDACAACSAGG